jgi:hypothetical protein
MSARADFFEIDISLLDIRFDQLHPDWFTDIQTLKSFHQLAFNWDGKQPDPRPLLGVACDDRIKPFSDP